jgi:hypothetical protein
LSGSDRQCRGHFKEAFAEQQPHLKELVLQAGLPFAEAGLPFAEQTRGLCPAPPTAGRPRASFAHCRIHLLQQLSNTGQEAVLLTGFRIGRLGFADFSLGRIIFASGDRRRRDQSLCGAKTCHRFIENSSSFRAFPATSLVRNAGLGLLGSLRLQQASTLPAELPLLNMGVDPTRLAVEGGDFGGDLVELVGSLRQWRLRHRGRKKRIDRLLSLLKRRPPFLSVWLRAAHTHERQGFSIGEFAPQFGRNASIRLSEPLKQPERHIRHAPLVEGLKQTLRRVVAEVGRILPKSNGGARHDRHQHRLQREPASPWPCRHRQPPPRTAASHTPGRPHHNRPATEASIALCEAFNEGSINRRRGPDTAAQRQDC